MYTEDITLQIVWNCIAHMSKENECDCSMKTSRYVLYGIALKKLFGVCIAIINIEIYYMSIENECECTLKTSYYKIYGIEKKR